MSSSFLAPKEIGMIGNPLRLPSREKNGKYENNNQSHIMGFAKDGLPYIIAISGHFSAGKTVFYDELGMQMSALGSPVQRVVNYKERSRRATELLGVDYILVDSDEKYDKFVESGDIVVPYIHNNHKYGLSKRIMDALNNKNVPLMITDANGLNSLSDYLKSHRIQNKVISFMLHTSKDDAIKRLFDRAGRVMTKDEIKEIKMHMESFDDELELYRNHEYLFRHVFKNDTISGISKHERIQHIAERALQIIDLERILNMEKPADFREAYVGYAVQKLFGTSTTDLLNSLNQGVRLVIPEEVIDKYSSEQGVSTTVIKRVAKRGVIGAADHYGILTLYLAPSQHPIQKRYLVDLIEEAVGLKHQYRQTGTNFSNVSKLSLKHDRQNLSDFYISFSPFDTTGVPHIYSRIHTIALEGLLYNKQPNILPLPHDKAKEFIEGNGS